ncbi:MAG: carboxypeptidase regulatory-like domain-containing protein [Planctomycetes bacterium]|nr:carboxypeptidase regulatory-like domain-containing protein [Planctomycetota bacterium]
MRRLLLFVLLAAAVFVPLHFANGRFAAPPGSDHGNAASTGAPIVERDLTVSPASGTGTSRDSAAAESRQRAVVEQPVRKGIGLRFVDQRTGNGIAGLRIDRPPMAPDAPTTDATGAVEVAGPAQYSFESSTHGKGRVVVPHGASGPHELRLAPAFPIAIQIEGGELGSKPVQLELRAVEPLQNDGSPLQVQQQTVLALPVTHGQWGNAVLPAGRWRVTCSDGFVATPSAIDVGERERWVVRLERSGLTGRVVDRSGAPCPGVEIHDAKIGGSRLAVTDDAGGFHLPLVRGPVFVDVARGDARYDPLLGLGPLRRGVAENVVVLDARRQHRLELFLDGRPLAPAHVEILRSAGPSSVFLLPDEAAAPLAKNSSERSSDTGVFELDEPLRSGSLVLVRADGLAEGTVANRWTVEADAERVRYVVALESRRLHVQVRAGPASQGVDVAVELWQSPAGRGALPLLSGSPWAGAKQLGQPAKLVATATTTGSGRVTFDRLVGDQHVVRVLPGSGRAEIVDVPPGTVELAIDLPDTTSVVGRLLRTEATVSWPCSVELTLQGSRQRVVSANVEGEAFTLSGVENGVHDVSLRTGPVQQLLSTVPLGTFVVGNGTELVVDARSVRWVELVVQSDSAAKRGIDDRERIVVQAAPPRQGTWNLGRRARSGWTVALLPGEYFVTGSARASHGVAHTTSRVWIDGSQDRVVVSVGFREEPMRLVVRRAQRAWAHGWVRLPRHEQAVCDERGEVLLEESLPEGMPIELLAPELQGTTTVGTGRVVVTTDPVTGERIGTVDVP